jgi:hypothetical protein
MKSCISTGLSLPIKLMRKIDLERGDVPRSKYLLRILERMYSNEEQYEGKNTNCDTQFQCSPRVEALRSHELRDQQNLIVPMDQEKKQSKVNNICDAIGCNLRSTTELQVNAGQKRSITLYLCGSCVNKFRDQSQQTKLGE